MKTTHNNLATGLAIDLALSLILCGLAPAQAASSNARNFEGVWMAAEGAPPDANAQGDGPPPGAPQGGPGNGDSLQVELTGTVLQCAPVEHLSVGGGGMSMLLLQSATQIVLVSEFDMDIGRKIYLDTEHPDSLVPQPNGHSIGHWADNTLIVDTLAYADKNGKDAGQHVVERFNRNGDVLVDAVSVTDKNGKTSQRSLNYISSPDVQFNENVCEEGASRYQVINGTLDNPNVPPSRK